MLKTRRDSAIVSACTSSSGVKDVAAGKAGFCACVGAFNGSGTMSLIVDHQEIHPLLITRKCLPCDN